MTGVDKDGNITTEPMKRPPTMREIMSHTAGFGYGLGEVHPVDKLYREKKVLGATSLKQMIDRTAEIPLMYQPGARWVYRPYQRKRPRRSPGSMPANPVC